MILELGEDVSDVPQVQYDVTDTTGAIACKAENGSWEPIGTCFAFRNTDYLLTAGHCVPDSGQKGMGVAFPGMEEAVPVVEIRRHPKADVAMVRVAPGHGASRAFVDVDTHYPGKDVWAFGFPGSDAGEQERATPRIYRGYSHRTMRYSSPTTRSTYGAIELSFAPPTGLSGAPVYHRSRFPLEQGLIAEDHQVTSAAEFEEEIDRQPGEEKRVVYRRVVDFGIAVLLEEIRDWLDEVAPAAGAK